MRRRDFISLLASLAGSPLLGPLAAHAQSGPGRHIGVLMAVADDAEGRGRIAEFRQALAALGWKEGSNVRVDYRWAAADAARAQTFAAELVRMAPDVIVVNGSIPLAAVKRATSTIPVVFVQVFDPVAAGFVANMARPGGNITGFINYEDTMGGKWLELLKDVAPHTDRVTVLLSPQTPNWEGRVRVITSVSGAFGVEVTAVGARDVADLEHAVEALGGDRQGGLIVMPDALTTVHRERLVELAGLRRVPAIYPSRLFVDAGGLISYGVDNKDLYRRGAGYVDRVLKGTKPADLPVQAPTKFELVVNLKAARAQQIEISPNLLARADDVIE